MGIKCPRNFIAYKAGEEKQYVEKKEKKRRKKVIQGRPLSDLFLNMAARRVSHRIAL